MKTTFCQTDPTGRKKPLIGHCMMLKLLSLALMLLLIFFEFNSFAQDSCSNALKINADYVCNATTFNANGAYWIEFDPSSDSVTMTVFRDTTNNASYSVYIYSGSCDSLQIMHSFLGQNRDTLSFKSVFNYGECHILITGTGQVSICLKNDLFDLHLNVVDNYGDLLQQCGTGGGILDYNCPVETCIYDTRLCVGDQIYIQGEWEITGGLSHFDSVVFDIPGNTGGYTHYVINNPAPGSLSPILSIIYAYSGMHTACMTVWCSHPLDPNPFCNTTCFNFFVDTIPSFVLSLVPDSICPDCDEALNNDACIHLSSINFDVNDPSLGFEIDWGHIPNYIVSDSCAVFFETGIDTIIVSVSNHCGTFRDTAILVVTLFPLIYMPDSMCANDQVHFYGASGCSDATISFYEWDFGDGDTLSGSLPGSCDHIYTSPGTYIVELEITDSCGNHDSITHTIVISPLPVKPDVIGNRNNCDNVANYYVANPQPNCIYIWTIDSAYYSSNVFPSSGISNQIHWNTLYFNSSPGYANLIVHCINTLTGCTNRDTVRIMRCCVGSMGYINDSIVDTATFFNTSAFLNGDIILNCNITLLTSDTIYMGPEARIIVNPPYTFTANTVTIQAGCRYMWDGIYVNDSNAKVVLQNSCIVEDALNAVVSDKGGKFELSGTMFYDNYISVLVRNYFFLPGHNWPKHKGKITGCTFRYRSSCIPPYNGQRPKFGVYANNVFALTIGDSASASLKNTFKNLYCGIYSFQSRLNIFNNRFTDIKTPSGVICPSSHGDFAGLYCEAAIHYVKIYNDAYHYNSSILVLGGNCLNSRNVFDTCTTGVYTYQTVTKINNCKFNNTAWGVYCRDILSSSYVLNCKFKSTVSKGIWCVNTLPTNISLSIKYDTIYDPLNGIYVSNISSHPTVPNARVIVSNNNIQLNRSSGVMYGIRLENAHRVLAKCNNIYRPSRPTVANRLNVRGFQVEQSISDTLRSNTTTNLGIGIKGAGSLLGTQFKCNTSSYNYNGFYFDASYNLVQSVLSKQGDSTHPTDNKWYPYSSYYGIDGSLSGTSLKWFCRNSYSLYYPTENPSLYGYIYRTLAYNPIAENCLCTSGTFLSAGINTNQSTSQSEINNSEIADIMNESNNYNELDESFKYFEKQYAYNVLNASALSLNSATTPYYNQLESGNIGGFEKVYSLIQISSIDSARLLNDIISPTNQIEINRKWVNKVYLDYIEPQLIIPQAIIDDLEVLASSSPFRDGDAVYTARAIVGYTEHFANPKSMEQDIDAVSTIKVVVYPNPAENNITLEIVGYSAEWCNFVLRNTLGVSVLEKVIISSDSPVTIDVSKICNGFYLYEIINKEKEVIGKGRLVISK